MDGRIGGNGHKIRTFHTSIPPKTSTLNTEQLGGQNDSAADISFQHGAPWNQHDGCMHWAAMTSEMEATHGPTVSFLLTDASPATASSECRTGQQQTNAEPLMWLYFPRRPTSPLVVNWWHWVPFLPKWPTDSLHRNKSPSPSTGWQSFCQHCSLKAYKVPGP